MSKITFKRIALVVVATLGLGVLSSGPSSAAIVTASDTLTASATTATISAGETASVTLTQTAIGQAAGDSITVTATRQSAPSGADGSYGFYVSDSSNAQIRTTAQTATLYPGKAQADYNGVAGATSGDISAYAGVTAASAFSATYRFSLMAPTVAGTYVYRFYATSGGPTAYTTVATPLTWTVTVTANTSDVATTASKFWLNGLSEYTNTSRGVNTAAVGYNGLRADSTLVVSAGTIGSYNAVGVLFPIMMNSSDTQVSTRTGGRVLDSMVITLSGPGALAVNSRYTGLSTTYSKQVTIAFDETAVVYSDGSAGVGTLTAYDASVSPANALTQGTKSVTFVGRATTFTVSAYSATARAGGNANVKYAGAADSASAGLKTIRFTATDAAGNAVTTAALSTAPGDNSGAGFWAISSDTSVLAAGEVTGTTWASGAERRSPALSCSYGDGSTDKPAGYWYCQGRVYDSGTVTLTVVDSRTLSGSVPTTATTSAVYKSAAFSVTFAGAGYTGTMALDKSSYTVGEKALLTLTCKDSAARNIADGSSTTCFTGLNFAGPAPTFSVDSSANASGGSFTDLVKYLDGSGTTGTSVTSYVSGTDTAMVYMPTVAGTYTLKGKTGAAGSAEQTLLTFTVTDPVQAAQDKAIADAQAAADAATDAALQAIDAANAATDAANLSAEAADAATVAAEEAKDAADAATAAVEALATQVATLMAALQAQIRSLANTVAKIAKKVKA